MTSRRIQRRLATGLLFALLVPGIAQAGRTSPPTARAAARPSAVVAVGDDLGVRFELSSDPAAKRASGSEPIDVALADFDEDGVADLLTLARSAGASTLEIALTSDGRREAVALPAGAARVAAGDFDADGHSDAAIVTGSEIRFVKGDGAGRLAPAGTVACPGPVTALRAADVGVRDGLADLLVGSFENGSPVVMVFAGPLGASAAQPRTIAVDAPVAALDAGDLDADGFVDVVAGAGGSLVTISRPGGRVSVGWPLAASGSISVGGRVTALAVANFEGDAKCDVAYSTDGGLGVASVDESGARLVAHEVAGRGAASRVEPLALSDPKGYRAICALSPEGGIELVETSGRRAELSLDAAAIAPLPISVADAMSSLAVAGHAGTSTLSARAAQEFVVTTTADGGSGSLAEAISLANATPDLDTIRFAIPGTGPFVICPTAPLPVVTSPLILDATTQPGYSGSPVVRIDGACGDSRIFLAAGNSAVRGFELTNFDSAGVLMSGAGGSVVEGNRIDGRTRPAGVESIAGLLIFGSPDVRVGGTTAAARNVIFGTPISGGHFYGIHVPSTDSPRCVVTGNYLGTDAAGANALGGMCDTGVQIFAPEATVGGTAPGAGNLISGGFLAAVGLVVDGAGGLVQQNLIGVDATGTRDIGALQTGVFISSDGNVVGGTSPTARNVISGINGHAVDIFTDSNENVVLGNYLGVDVTGQNEIFTDSAAIYIAGSGNTIGGDAPAAGNLVRGASGVVMQDGVENAVLSNTMFGLSGPAVQVPIGAAPAANDHGDADDGPNRLQNFPEIASAMLCEGQVMVRGILDSRPNRAYRLQVFASEGMSSDGWGWTQTLVADLSVSTDGTGIANVEVDVTNVSAGSYISATATDAERNTSSISRPVLVRIPTADVGLDYTRAPGPVRRGQNVVYTATVTNSGPEAACHVTATLTAPVGTVFASATSSQGTLATPPVGGSGAVVATLGALAPGETATVTMTVTVSADAPGSISSAAAIDAQVEDSVPENDLATDVATVVVDPTITKAKTAPAGQPFQVVLTGGGFLPETVVYIGADETPWANTVVKKGRKIVLKQGKVLKARFPKGVAVPIRVVNPDGGEATVTVTR